MLGIRTLLVTDVVDSMQLTDRLGTERAMDLWAHHDTRARELLVLHGGREIDKTDGFLLLFDDVTSAVAYALAYHDALVPLGLSARAGIHRGEVGIRVTPAHEVALGAKPVEVDGPAKPTAARVMALARGGQTLLTAAARAGLDESFAAASHGHYKLKGLAEPVELFEVGPPGQRLLPPVDGPKAYRVVPANGGWRPATEVPHNLPAERDPFVGRMADLTALAQHLDGGARLVTVLGPAGAGKTRLVTHYARACRGDFPGGAWFVDLSDVQDAEDLVFTFARTLGVTLGHDDPVGQLGHGLAERGSCLIVLDNFEQIVRLGASMVGAWVDRATQATFVVTSRAVLAVPGERVVPIAPLCESDAFRLFVERARAARGSFDPSPTERDAIGELSRTLDGLPLCIELAASRTRTMSVDAIQARMGERFRLLTSAGGRPTRQATLRGALDWSWGLLSPDQREALVQITVFAGGFDLEAAEDVLAVGDAWSADLVQALVDQSLVRTGSDGRFDLLMSVREYALDRARDDRVDLAPVRVRHASWFARYGAEPHPPQVLAQHRGNLWSALGFASTAGLGLEAGRLWVAVYRLAEATGPWGPLVEAGTRLPPIPDQSLERRARSGIAAAATEAGDAALALQESARGVALADGLSAVEQAEAWLVRARALWMAGHLDEVEAAVDAGTRFACAANDRYLEIRLRMVRSVARWTDTERQLDPLGAALEAALRCGFSDLAGIARTNLAITLVGLGRSAEATRVAQEGLADPGGVTEVRVMYLHNALAMSRWFEGQCAASLEHARGAYERALRQGHPKLVHQSLASMALADADLGRHGEARGHIRDIGAIVAAFKDPYEWVAVFAKVALAWCAIGDRQAAVEALRKARELSVRAGLPTRNWMGAQYIAAAEARLGVGQERAG